MNHKAKNDLIENWNDRKLAGLKNSLLEVCGGGKLASFGFLVVNTSSIILYIIFFIYNWNTDTNPKIIIIFLNFYFCLGVLLLFVRNSNLKSQGMGNYRTLNYYEISCEEYPQKIKSRNLQFWQNKSKWN